MISSLVISADSFPISQRIKIVSESSATSGVYVKYLLFKAEEENQKINILILESGCCPLYLEKSSSMKRPFSRSVVFW